MKLILRSEKGVAMLIAMLALFILTLVVGELVYQSTVYSSVVFKARDQLRAQLLARSGLRLALFQLRAAKKAKGKAKTLGFGENTAVIDKIWQTPLVLPPPALPGMSDTDKSAFDAFGKSLGFDGTVAITIVGEAGRLSLNQLVWPLGSASNPKGTTGGDQVDTSKGSLDGNLAGLAQGSQTQPGGTMNKEQRAEALKKVRASFSETVSNLLDNRRRSDDDFRNKYGNVQGATLVGNLIAWMDPDAKEDGDNRDKGDYYSNLPNPYSIKNAPLASMTELHMVKGFDETLSAMFAENFTTQTVSSLDVNKAAISLLGALIPELRPDDLKSIEKRRTDDSAGGPFANEQDFWNYLQQTLGVPEEAKKNFAQRGIKILGNDTAFHAAIVAQSGLATKTWTADFGPLPPKIDPVDPNAVAQAPTPPAPAPQTGDQSKDKDKENQNKTGSDSDDFDSLTILYLKADS